MLSSGPTVRQLSSPFVNPAYRNSFVGGAPALPAVPQNVAGNAGDGAVLLSWNAAANATAYDYRLDQNDGTITQLGNVTSINIAGLTNDQSYQFQVRGRNGSDVSDWSTVIARTPVVSGGNGNPLLAKALNWAVLSGGSFLPGRIGMKVDYSELNDVGDHVFLVERTHGTTGAVSVQYMSEGDSHSTVSGTLNWAAGEADIKSITVNVASKSPGDHRMRLRLHTPTGGAVLHFGANHTVGYGVIDDGTFPPDSEAVYFNQSISFNQDATTGSGTRLDPYNNIYAAIANVGSKKYICGQGVVVPDGTNYDGPYSINSYSNCITPPPTRSGEDTRLYIRNWPGQTLAVNGNGSTLTQGFFAKDGQSYHTIRGIDFLNLNSTSGSGKPCGGVWYHYGGSNGINTELCNFDGVNGNENNAGLNWYEVIGAKAWRCTFNNISKAGIFSNANAAGILSFRGNHMSVQRCEFNQNMAKGIYHKQTVAGLVGMACKFSIFRDVYANYGQSGDQDPGHGHILFSHNALIGSGARFYHLAINRTQSEGPNQITNNYFYQSASGVAAAIHNRQMGEVIAFGNIFHNCRQMYTEDTSDAVLAWDQPLFLNNNVVVNNSYRYAYMNQNGYSSKAAFTDTSTGGNGFAEYSFNDVTTAPNTTDPDNEDFSLPVGSSALGASIGSDDCGINLAGFELSLLGA